MLSGEMSENSFAYNFILEIQILNMLILDAIFLCWVVRILQGLGDP